VVIQGLHRSVKEIFVKKIILISGFFSLLIAVTYFLPYGTWAELGDLPAHPLIVHGVVVLLPLVSLLLIAGLFKRELFEKAHLLLIAVLGTVTVGVLAAKSSGDSLAAAVGLPEFHAEWGNNLVPIAIALFVSVILYSFFSFYKEVKSASLVAGILMAVLAFGSIAMTYVVGHSGAESVWKNRYQFVKAQEGTDSRAISLDEVRLHNTSDDCWTVVQDGVYDVTSFVSRHPAGSSAIKEMCGTNASEDYLGEHSGQQEPEMWLEKLKIGTLKP
jgi:hypothetical protein